jgi:AraC-like DNA-binding protein
MNLTLDFLLITGLLTTLLIIIILVGKKEKEFPQRVLIYIFIAIFLVFLSYYAYLHKIRWLFYLTYIFSDSADVLIGPLLFIYVKGVIGSSRNNLKYNYVHFIFPILYILFIPIPLLIVMANETYELTYISTLEPLLLYIVVYSYTYCIYTYRKLVHFQKLVRYNYSNLENRDLNWIKYLLIGAISILTVDIITSIYESFAGDMGLNIGFITVIPIVFLVMYLGYYGVSQSKILLPDYLFDTKEDVANVELINASKKSSKYIYDVAEMEKLKIEIDLLVQEKKPFLDEDLTLSSLADQLKISDKKLSTLLNQYMEASFYDYINGYRVEEVKKRLALPDSNTYTILAIAYDCGFKSKSSFNRIFKNNTHLAPSEYQKRLLLDTK